MWTSVFVCVCVCVCVCVTNSQFSLRCPLFLSILGMWQRISTPGRLARNSALMLLLTTTGVLLTKLMASGFCPKYTHTKRKVNMWNVVVYFAMYIIYKMK